MNTAGKDVLCVHGLDRSLDRIRIKQPPPAAIHHLPVHPGGVVKPPEVQIQIRRERHPTRVALPVPWERRGREEGEEREREGGKKGERREKQVVSVLLKWRPELSELPTRIINRT